MSNTLAAVVFVISVLIGVIFGVAAGHMVWWLVAEIVLAAFIARSAERRETKPAMARRQR